MTPGPPPRGDIWMAVIVVILIGVLSGGWLLLGDHSVMEDHITSAADPEPATVKCTVFETDGDPAAMCFVSGDVDFAWIDANATENGTVNLSELPTDEATARVSEGEK